MHLEHLTLERDSITIIYWIAKDSSDNPNPLLLDIKLLISITSFKVHYVYRKANLVADYMIGLCFSTDFMADSLFYPDLYHLLTLDAASFFYLHCT